MHAKILVALEDEYRAYREVLAAGVKALRPAVQVETALPSDVEEEMARFDPQVIISSVEATDPNDAVAWITLSTDPSQPTKTHIGGRHIVQSNPTLFELLEVLDEAIRLAGERFEADHADA